MKGSAQAENNDKEKSFQFRGKRQLQRNVEIQGKRLSMGWTVASAQLSFQWSSCQRRALREIFEGEQLSSFAAALITHNCSLLGSEIFVAQLC